MVAQVYRSEIFTKVGEIVQCTFVPPPFFLVPGLSRRKRGAILPMEGKSGRKSGDFRSFFFRFSDCTSKSLLRVQCVGGSAVILGKKFIRADGWKLVTGQFLV